MNLPLECKAVQSSFSSYLDGAISGLEMQRVAAHLEVCHECSAEFASLRSIQQSLSSMGAARPPADLGMRLRLAISREQSRTLSSLVDRISLSWDNSLRPLLLQVGSGVAATLLLVGGAVLMLSMVGGTPTVMANDEPLGAMTSPHYEYSVSQPHPVIAAQNAAIVVEAEINRRGEVYDFHIVAGPHDPAVEGQVRDLLVQSIFEPARVFGEPTLGHVVVTFSGVSVRA